VTVCASWAHRASENERNNTGPPRKWFQSADGGGQAGKTVTTTREGEWQRKRRVHHKRRFRSPAPRPRRRPKHAWQDRECVAPSDAGPASLGGDGATIFKRRMDFEEADLVLSLDRFHDQASRSSRVRVGHGFALDHRPQEVIREFIESAERRLATFRRKNREPVPWIE